MYEFFILLIHHTLVGSVSTECQRVTDSVPTDRVQTEFFDVAFNKLKTNRNMVAKTETNFHRMYFTRVIQLERS